MIYSEVAERIIQGVLRAKPDVSRARLLMQIDAAFPRINQEISVAFAANEDQRPLLRKDEALVFIGGSIGIPASVLKDYLRDATLVLSTGDTASLVEPYADYLRVRDNRLAYWSYSNLLISAKNNATNGGGAYAGAATLTCIKSPDVPTLATDTFVAPEEFVSMFTTAFIEYLLGQPEAK